MPMSVENDYTELSGLGNARLLLDKVKGVGDNLNSVPVYIGETRDAIPKEFRIDVIYLMDKKR